MKKHIELEETLQKLNSVLNDDELTKISDRLRYGIGCTTTKKKFDDGVNIIFDTKDKYINRISEIINQMFLDKYNELK
jgi:hypothetical protein